MKCESCWELLEEYVDGELSETESSNIAAHLITCSACSVKSATLIAEQDMFLRYDRELEVPDSLWQRIAEHTTAPIAKESLREQLVSLFRMPAFRFSFATAAALLAIAVVVGLNYINREKSEASQKITAVTTPTGGTPQPSIKPEPEQSTQQKEVVSFHRARIKRLEQSRQSKYTAVDQSDVLSSDFGFQDLDDEDTAKHLEQTQNLLRSIRNVQLNDTDQEIDVSYDKALSRRLLSENIVLRRDAEMKAKFPTKVLLSDLEPFLIDIANLPDQAKPEDVRAIKERVQKTEIVAALIGY